MNIQEALKKTGKAKRDRWGENEYIYKKGMYFIDNSGKPFNREDIAEDEWQPYHEVKEISPENAGELWEKRECFYHTSGSQRSGGLTLHSDVGTVDMRNVVHGKDDWKREFPKVEDANVERIEIENIQWEQGTTIHPVGGYCQPILEKILGKPMKMILEIPTEAK